MRLAVALSADLVLMDEKEGRQCAAMLGIRTIGVLGVLIVAKHAGVFSAMKDEITKLRKDAGFFIGKALEARLLGEVGE